MQAMLLAAGLGTRLRPLTEVLPKPIVPLANRPLAGFAMDHLARSGVRHIVANTHPRPEVVEKTLAGACPSGVALRFSREATLLGTGGGLRRARPLFEDPSGPVIVMNGDTLFAPALERALRAHESQGAIATMILRHTPDPERFGAVGVDAHGRVATLLGAPEGRSVAELLMFTGVHILAPEAFDAMPESGCVIRSAYRRWVDGGAVVLGVVDDSPWADLGTVSEYHRLNLELASGGVTWPGVEPVGGSILADDMMRGGNLRRCVIGERVRIDPEVELEGCVVWPGTHVTESDENAVLTPDFRVALGS